MSWRSCCSSSRASPVLWENGKHQGLMDKETALPHPSCLRKHPGKAEPGGPQDAELCWAQSPSLRELLWRNKHILCLSWLYPSGVSSGGASELGNTNNAEWDIQGSVGVKSLGNSSDNPWKSLVCCYRTVPQLPAVMVTSPSPVASF